MLTTRKILKLFSQPELIDQIGSEPDVLSFATALRNSNTLASHHRLDVYQALEMRRVAPVESTEVTFGEDDLPTAVARKVATFKFRLALVNLLKHSYSLKVVYCVHPPKTGGTSVFENLWGADDYVVISIDPDDNGRFIFSLLPLLEKKVRENPTLVVHSHLLYPHICGMLKLDASDLVIMLYRDPRSLHVSNSSHIYELLSGRKYADKSTIKQLLKYESLITGPQSRSRILMSEEYFHDYQNILCRYLFGEHAPEGRSFADALKWAAGSMYFCETKEVSDLLTHGFGVANPVFKNRSGFYDDVAPNGVPLRLVDLDMKLYGLLVDDRARSGLSPLVVRLKEFNHR